MEYRQVEFSPQIRKKLAKELTHRVGILETCLAAFTLLVLPFGVTYRLSCNAGSGNVTSQNSLEMNSTATNETDGILEKSCTSLYQLHIAVSCVAVLSTLLFLAAGILSCLVRKLNRKIERIRIIICVLSFVFILVLFALSCTFFAALENSSNQEDNLVFVVIEYLVFAVAGLSFLLIDFMRNCGCCRKHCLKDEQAIELAAQRRRQLEPT